MTKAYCILKSLNKEAIDRMDVELVNNIVEKIKEISNK